MLFVRCYVVLSADFDTCIALIGQEHVLTIYSLTNELVTSQHKELTNQHKDLTRRHKDMARRT